MIAMIVRVLQVPGLDFVSAFHAVATALHYESFLSIFQN
jgi:hypothetical protein